MKLPKIVIMSGNKSVTKPHKTSKKCVDKKKTFFQIISGFFAGFINGLFGGGGGMIIVPSLRRFLGYRTNSSHATAIAVILPLSVVSGAFYTAFGNFEWQPVIFTTLGVTMGGIAGAILLKKLRSDIVTLIFSAVMLLAGIKMLFF